MSHPERIVPDETEPGIVALHLKRYEFALPYCAARACSTPVAASATAPRYLAQAAERVVGVDVDDDGDRVRARRYAAPNVEFLVGRRARRSTVRRRLVRRRLLVRDDRARAATAERFVAELARVLKPGGRARRLDAAGGAHRRCGRTTRSTSVEFAPTTSRRCSARRSSSVELYGQRRLADARATALLQRLDVLGLRRRLPFLRRASRLAHGHGADGGRRAARASRSSATRSADATELVAVCRA